MANPSNDDGHPIGGQIDYRSSEPHGVQNFRSASAPVSLLRIGNYQIRSQNAPHLTAKWSYVNKQLNWEILEDRRKKKIKINWSSIAAIRVGHGGDLRILEIELYEPPRFYIEGELRPRARASYNLSSDFTGGQASTHRVHYLEFPPGKLERNMEPLFVLDYRLLESTGRSFPSLESPFFVGHVTGAPQGLPPPPPPPPPPPLPLISSRLLQHHQIPPDHSSVPISLSNSNLMDSISTGQQPANSSLPSLEDSQASDYNYPQPSLSLPRSETTLNLEMRLGPLAPSSDPILDLELGLGLPAHNATNYNPNKTRHGHDGYHQVDMGRHSGVASPSNPHLDLVLAHPSSSASNPVTDDHAGHRPDDERYNNRNNELLDKMTRE